MTLRAYSSGEVAPNSGARKPVAHKERVETFATHGPFEVGLDRSFPTRYRAHAVPE